MHPKLPRIPETPDQAQSQTVLVRVGGMPPSDGVGYFEFEARFGGYAALSLDVPNLVNPLFT